MSVLSRRIMAQVLDQIHRDGLTLRDGYQVDVAPLLDGPGPLHKRARAAFVELAETKWRFEDVTAQRFYERPLLDQTRPEPSEVRQGVVCLSLNPALAPYFFQLAADFTLTQFAGYLKLRSWYAMRLFEILAHHQQAGGWEGSLEEYRLLMDCAPERDALGQPVLDKAGRPKMKFAQVADLVSHTIEPAQAELAGTDYAFAYTVQQTPEGQGKGRPRVSGFRFELLRPVPVGQPEGGGQSALRREAKNVAQTLFPGQGNPEA